MSSNKPGFADSFSLFLVLAAVMVFLSYGMYRRRVETSPADFPGSSAFASSEKHYFNFEVEPLEEQMERLPADTEPEETRSQHAANSTNPAVTSQSTDSGKTEKQSLSDSMRWLNQSIDSLSEKLNQISKRLENTQDQALVEAEIKKAFREAFDSLANGKTTSSPDIDRPVLGDGIPEWIRQRVVERDRLLIPIESSLHGTLEECREELDAKLPAEVKKLIDEYVLVHVSADAIPGLTPEYIRESLVDPTAMYDNYQERPSGNFHQMWVRLSIDKPKWDQIREWESEIVTTLRVWLLGGLSLAFFGTLAGCSKVIQLLSVREQNRRQVRQFV